MIQIQKKCGVNMVRYQGKGMVQTFFFVGEINVTHYFITNIGAGLPDACVE